MCATNKAICHTCFRHCSLADGETGNCHARENRDGIIAPKNYGFVTSVALDPIEKKPLSHFMPGSMILSVGSYGCNMHCSFCQNYAISQSCADEVQAEKISPEELAAAAYRARSRGNIGVAFTYNEPLVSWEFVRDTSRLVRQDGMKNVIVTNGCVSGEVLEQVLPFTDAMNIDLKCFTQDGYKRLGGDLETVKSAIVQCAAVCHVEVTTLIVPGLNDNEKEIDALASWLCKNVGRETVLHVTRFFPRWQMSASYATDIKSLYGLAAVAERHLENVVVGNV